MAKIEKIKDKGKNQYKNKKKKEKMQEPLKIDEFSQRRRFFF